MLCLFQLLGHRTETRVTKKYKGRVLLVYTCLFILAPVLYVLVVARLILRHSDQGHCTASFTLDICLRTLPHVQFISPMHELIRIL